MLTPFVEVPFVLTRAWPMGVKTRCSASVVSVKGRRGGDRDAHTEHGALPHHALDFYPPSMGARQLLNDGEADAGPAGRSRAGLLAAPEAREHARQIPSGDADAGVGDLEDAVAAGRPDDYCHAAPGVRIPEGVREEVRDDLLKALRVAGDEGGLKAAGERDASVGIAVRQHLHLPGHDGGEVH